MGGKQGSGGSFGDFKTVDDVDFKGKRVLVRVGIDSPFDLDKKRIRDNDRLAEHGRLLAWLARKKAAVVAVGHQSRPGKPDFTDTSQHARLLSKHAGMPVKFVPDIIGKKATGAIEKLRPGEVLLLDNVRKLDEEMLDKPPAKHAKSRLVHRLQPLFDVYVNNAFSNCHRSHASMVGFTGLPRIAGPLIVSEVTAAEQARKQARRPSIYIMGGLKIFDYFDLMEKSLAEGTVDRILASGTLGELCLIALGNRLGRKEEFLGDEDSMEKKSLLDLLPHVKRLLKKYPDRFEIPVDLAEETGPGKRRELPVSELPSSHMIWDIGGRTAERFSDIIKKAKTIYLKGSPGDYRVRGFSRGSEMIIRAIASSTRSGAYSLIGGGSAADIVDRYSKRSLFSHISLAGGALMDYMAGNKLPGLEALSRKTS